MVGLISTIIVIPLLGALAVWTWPRGSGRAIALAFNGITAGCALALWAKFNGGAAGLQLIERHAWIPAIGAEYLVGVDGLSLLLVLLTSLIVPFSFLAQEMSRGFMPRCSSCRRPYTGRSQLRTLFSGFFFTK
jgi:NADH-quinone oxidoreductase subunit M